LWFLLPCAVILWIFHVGTIRETTIFCWDWIDNLQPITPLLTVIYTTVQRQRKEEEEALEFPSSRKTQQPSISSS